jgi:hypothetical protein
MLDKDKKARHRLGLKHTLTVFMKKKKGATSFGRMSTAPIPSTNLAPIP